MPPLICTAGALSDNSTRDLAVKLRGAAYGDTAALRTQITALRAERAQLLDTYRGFEKRQFPDPSALRDSAITCTSSAAAGRACDTVSV